MTFYTNNIQQCLQCVILIRLHVGGNWVPGENHQLLYVIGKLYHILSSTPHHGRVLNSHTLVVEGKDCLYEGPPQRCNG